jgi:hypothetical protein
VILKLWVQNLQQIQFPSLGSKHCNKPNSLFLGSKSATNPICPFRSELFTSYTGLDFLIWMAAALKLDTVLLNLFVAWTYMMMALWSLSLSCLLTQAIQFSTFGVTSQCTWWCLFCLYTLKCVIYHQNWHRHVLFVHVKSAGVVQNRLPCTLHGEGD